MGETNAINSSEITGELLLMRAVDFPQIMEAFLKAVIPNNSLDVTWVATGSFFSEFYAMAAWHLVRASVLTYCTKLANVYALTAHLDAIELETLLSDIAEAGLEVEAGILRTPTCETMQEVFENTLKLLFRFCSPTLFPEKSDYPFTVRMRTRRNHC